MRAVTFAMRIVFGLIALGGVVGGALGCVSTRVNLGSAPAVAGPKVAPDYVDYVDYYALGLIGRNEIDLGHVCGDQTARAVEAVRTLEDGVITFFTLGIYAPLTVKAWCE